MTSSESAASLSRFFRPRSIALVGATERSAWSNFAYDNIRRFGFAGGVHLVNPKGGEIYGQAAATSCTAIGEAIDTALLMVPEAAVADAIADFAAAGGSGAVLLASGFAETGADGQRRQAEIAALAQAHGIRLLGPNCLGFINYIDAAPLWTTVMRRPMADPAIAIVSQSGSIATQLASFAHQQRIALSYLISTGNEADVDVAMAIDFLAEQEGSKVIALFVETVRDTNRFAQAVHNARRNGKAIVALKIGTSEVTARAAQAHTGALVGNDRIFSAACKRLGIVRVSSLEDLIITSDMIARIGCLKRDGIGLISMSGGMCEIAADQLDAEGMPFADLSTDTAAQLTKILPGYGTPHNPLDITGAAMLKPELIAQAMQVIRADENIGVSAFLFDAPPEDKGAAFPKLIFKHVGEGSITSGGPSLLLSNALTPVTRDGRVMTEQVGVPYSGAGLHLGMRGLHNLIRWSRMQRDVAVPVPRAQRGAHSSFPTTERQTLALLAQHGVPVIPCLLARDKAEAVAQARTLEGPVAMKILSPDIAHKTEVGGVVLSLEGDVAVANAFTAMMENVKRHCPKATIEGVVISPMRNSGIELFVGVTRDPQWGLSIAIGLGGIWIELLKDSAVRLLPVSERDVFEMLDELRGKALLDGYRGAPPVDRSAVAKAVIAVGETALALGDQLEALEINPLYARGALVEALDGLAIAAASASQAA